MSTNNIMIDTLVLINMIS